MIVGQERAVGRFTEAMRSGALQHAWLLAGPRGVGKASFASAAATRLLSEAAGPAVGLSGLDTPPDHRIAHLMAAGSHPDFRRLERELNDKGDALRRNINVRQVRKLGEFFSTTTALSPWRAVVIDSVDDLETEGANALLKMLEEPPANSVFFLVSHAPGRLLPTIRSRCRRLEFAGLPSDAMTSLLTGRLPGKSAAEIAALTDLSGGSAGLAIRAAELDLAPLEAEALRLMAEGDPDNGRRSALASQLAPKAAAERYAAFVEMVPALIAREARRLPEPQRARALDAYARARETAALAPRLTFDPGMTVFRLGGILAGVALKP